MAMPISTTAIHMLSNCGAGNTGRVQAAQSNSVNLRAENTSIPGLISRDDTLNRAVPPSKNLSRRTNEDHGAPRSSARDQLYRYRSGAIAAARGGATASLVRPAGTDRDKAAPRIFRATRHSALLRGPR